MMALAGMKKAKLLPQRNIQFFRLSTLPPPQKSQTVSFSSFATRVVILGALSFGGVAYAVETNPVIAEKIGSVSPELIQSIEFIRNLVPSSLLKNEKSSAKKEEGTTTAPSSPAPIEKTVDTSKDVIVSKQPEVKEVKKDVAAPKEEEFPIAKMKEVLLRAKKLVEDEEKERQIKATQQIAKATEEKTSSEVSSTAEIPVPIQPPPAVAIDSPSPQQPFSSPSVNNIASILPSVVSEHTALTAGQLSSELLNDFAKQSQILRKELETRYLQDVQTVSDPIQLRSRVIQLAGELFERISLEGMRLDQTIRKVEALEETKYLQLLNEQRKQLEAHTLTLLQKKDEEMLQQTNQAKQELLSQFEQQLNSAIRSQAEGFQATLQKELAAQATAIHTELEQQLTTQVTMLRKNHVDQLMQLQPKVESLNNQIAKFGEVVDETASSIASTIATHTVSHAILALELYLSSNNLQAKPSNVLKCIDGIKKACKGDELVTAVIESMPASVYTGEVLSLPELQVRFLVMKDEVRKAALAPDSAPPLIGQLIGSLLAGITWSPKGYVRGDGVEESLARAQYLLDRGKLKECLSELNQVQGYSVVLMTDWRQLASDRIAVDQALQVLKTRAILSHKALSA